MLTRDKNSFSLRNSAMYESNRAYRLVEIGLPECRISQFSTSWLSNNVADS